MSGTPLIMIGKSNFLAWVYNKKFKGNIIFLIGSNCIEFR